MVIKDSSGLVTHAVEYTYDAFDRRIAKTVDSDGVGSVPASSEHFVYEGAHVSLVFDQDGNLSQRYLYGPQIDQVLSQEDAQTGEVLWALTDHQGTVRDVVNNDGEVVNHITYNSFGQVTEESNLEANFRFGFTGRDVDEETDLYYYRARYYDSAVGQFISEDPIGFSAGDANLRRYVGNSPLNATDPSGLKVYVGFRGAVYTLPGVHTSIILVPDNFEDFSSFNRPEDNIFRGGDLNDGSYDPLFDENGDRYAILSAFPTNQGTNERNQLFGELKFIPNDSSDRIEELQGLIEVNPPPGVSDTEFIRTLIRTAQSYDDSATYNPVFSVAHIDESNELSVEDREFLNSLDSQWYSSDVRQEDIDEISQKLERIYSSFETSSTYNSNSFVSGVLIESGITPPSLELEDEVFVISTYSAYEFDPSTLSDSITTGIVNYWAPLYDHPLPSEYFASP